MEQFLLNFVNSFKERFYSWHLYSICKEVSCGFFCFDNYRPLPGSVIQALNLEEHLQFDDERDTWLFFYSPNFLAP